MEAAGGDTQYTVRHSQAGCISAVQGKRNGGETSEIRVRCDCPPQTLLATLAHSLVEASCFGIAGRGLEFSESDLDFGEAQQPVLLAQIGECRHRIRAAGSTAPGGAPASIQLLSGRIFLRGDILLVSGGKAFYSENSHLWMSPLTAQSGSQKINPSAPPTFSGATAQRGDLFACVANDLDGACLFYEAERSLLQLGSRQTILQRPLLQLGGRQFRLDLLARQQSHLDRIRPATTKDLPSAEAASTAANAFLKSSVQRQSTTSFSLDMINSELLGEILAPVRTLLLVGGRCMLHSDTLLVLSGLLHFAGSWYRVQTACSGSGFQQAIPRLTGTSLLKRRRKKANSSKQRNEDEAAEPEETGSASSAAESDRPLLLNNVWLYAQGGTVFMGGSAILTEAQLAMSADLRPVALDQQERMLSKLPAATRRKVPCRLFLQCGRFCVSPGSCSLRAVAGVAWLRGRKTSIGKSANEQLLVKDAVAFLTQQRPGNGAGGGGGVGINNGSGDSGGYWMEGRDLLYKDGMLYLDDLTPVLLGGRICLGQQEMRLDWLSGWADDSKSAGDDSHDGESSPNSAATNSESDAAEQPEDSSSDAGAVERELLNDGICLLESGGRSLHILRGRLRLASIDTPSQTETVLVDRGVAYFQAESTRPIRMTAAFPPPKIVGWPLLPRPSDLARQWATSIDRQADTATFVEARLSLKRNTLWLNDEVPLLKSCRLVLNGRTYNIQSSSMPLVQLARDQQPESNGLLELQKLQQIHEQPVPDEQQLNTRKQEELGDTRQLELSHDDEQQQNAGYQKLIMRKSCVHGFIGGYSVVANRQTEALIFSLKARFPDGLQFLFDAA